MIISRHSSGKQCYGSGMIFQQLCSLFHDQSVVCFHYNARSFLIKPSGSSSVTSPLAANPATLNELLLSTLWKLIL